jgi:hypothetical protein
MNRDFRKSMSHSRENAAGEEVPVRGQHDRLRCRVQVSTALIYTASTNQAEHRQREVEKVEKEAQFEAKNTRKSFVFT